MKVLIFPIVIILLALTSCKKDDSESPISTIEKQVFAGDYDSSFVFNEFIPPLKIELVTDSVLNQKYGLDSIDINSDGSYDLIISQRFFLDESDMLELTNTNFPFCELNVKNGLEIAMKNETIYIGLGQTSIVHWVDTLNYNTRVDSLSDWSENLSRIWMWVVPPSSFWGSYGSWYNLTETEKYIGIRMKLNADYKFGWIKLYQYSRENFILISYAIEK